MNIYLFTGDDLYRLEKSFHTFIEKKNVTKDDIIRIDASNPRTFSMEQALLECDTFSLFETDHKIVILRNPFFLNASSKESDKNNKKEERILLLEQYLKNPNPSSILIFYCHGYKADSRKKEYKLLQKYGCEVIDCHKMDDKEFHSYALKQLKSKSISLEFDAQNEFFQRVGTDTLLLHNAIEKIDLYDKKSISLEDVKHLVPMNPDINVFALTTAFTNGNLQECFKVSEEMLNANYDYIVLIAMIAKRLRSIYNVKLLHEHGLSDDQIATRMKLKRGNVYYILKDTTYLSSKKVLSYLNDLANLDQNIKKGEVSPKDGYEQFLLKNGKR